MPLLVFLLAAIGAVSRKLHAVFIVVSISLGRELVTHRGASFGRKNPMNDGQWKLTHIYAQLIFKRIDACCLDGKVGLQAYF